MISSQLRLHVHDCTRHKAAGRPTRRTSLSSLRDPDERVVGATRADDPEYIVRLVGQVVRVSVETVKIVEALPTGLGVGLEAG